MKTILIILLLTVTTAAHAQRHFWRSLDAYSAPIAKAIRDSSAYRGRLSDNQFGNESTGNKFSYYGSMYSPVGINNEFGAGSKFSSESPSNQFGVGIPIYQQGDE